LPSRYRHAPEALLNCRCSSPGPEWRFQFLS
jgi:hypothetical protein